MEGRAADSSEKILLRLGLSTTTVTAIQLSKIALLHNLDLYSDVMYILTVPIEYHWMKYAMWVSIGLPFFMSAKTAY